MSNETEEIVVVTEEAVIKDGVIILDIVDIEEYVLAGRPVPHAHRYKYRVNKQHFVVDTPELTRERILEKAGMVPTDEYRLRLKRRHGPPEEIKPGQKVHLRDHGVERFIAQPKEVQDELETRRQFALSTQDTAFLETLGLRWEALRNVNRLWVLIYDLPLPNGFRAATADVAIEVASGYPTSQLDMAYFCPPVHRLDGKAIAQTQVTEQLDGRSWQRWSRHRTGISVWVPGVDNLETHFAYIQDWLARETEQ